MGRRFGGREGDCPVTEVVSERLVRLPFYYDLSEADQTRVIQAVRSFQVQRRPEPIRETLRLAAARRHAA